MALIFSVPSSGCSLSLDYEEFVPFQLSKDNTPSEPNAKVSYIEEIKYEGPCSGVAYVGILVIDGNELLKTGYKFRVVKKVSGNIVLPKLGTVVVPKGNKKEFYFLWSPDVKNGKLDVTIAIKSVSSSGKESKEYFLHVSHNQQSN